MGKFHILDKNYRQNLPTVLYYFIIVFLFLIYPRIYDTLDDVLNQAKLYGVFLYTSPSPYIYSNYLLGKFYIFIESIGLSFNFYVFLISFPILVLLLSHRKFLMNLCEHVISLRKYNRQIAFICSLFFAVLIQILFLENIQYTIAAGLYMYLAFYFFTNSKGKITWKIITVIFFIISGLMRLDMAILIGAIFFIPYFLWRFFTSQRKNIAREFRFALMPIVLFILIFLADYHYRKLPVYSQPSTEYSNIVDYKPGRYADDSVFDKIFSETGWTRNDFEFYRMRHPVFHPKFSKENIKKVSDILTVSNKKNILSRVFLGDLYYEIRSIILKPLSLLTVMLMLIWLTFTLRKKSFSEFIEPALISFIVSASFLYLAVFTKVPPFRIYFPIFLSCIFYALYKLSDKNEIAKSNVFVRMTLLIVFSLLFGASSFSSFTDSRQRKLDRVLYYSDFKDLHQFKNKTIVPVTINFLRYLSPRDKFSPLNQLRFSYGKPVFSDSFHLEVLQDNVCYLTSGNTERMQQIYNQFYIENYGFSVDFVSVYKGKKLDLFRFVKKEN